MPWRTPALNPLIPQLRNWIDAWQSIFSNKFNEFSFIWCECVLCLCVSMCCVCEISNGLLSKQENRAQVFHSLKSPESNCVFKMPLFMGAQRGTQPPLSHTSTCSAILCSFSFFHCLTHTPSYMHNGKEGGRERGLHLMAKCALSVAINSIGTDWKFPLQGSNKFANVDVFTILCADYEYPQVYVCVQKRECVCCVCH